jgi:probable 2-oxoglutarate dehydrogenase E1 component DHKTD1
LQSDGVISSDEASQLRKAFTATLDADLGKIDEYKPKSDMLEGKWSKLVWPNSEAASHEPDTGVDRDVLVKVAKASVTLPEDFVSTIQII